MTSPGCLIEACTRIRPPRKEVCQPLNRVLTPEADIRRRLSDVRSVPNSDIRHCFHSMTSSARPSNGSENFTPSVSAVLRLIANSTFVLLDRQLGRIDTPQNFPGVNTNQPARIQQAWAATYHAANSDVLSPWIDGWYGMLSRQRNKLLTLPMKEKIGADKKRLGPMSDDFFESYFEVRSPAGAHNMEEQF